MTPSTSILLVDDDAAFRHVMSGELARLGYRVSTAGTGVLCQLEAEGPFRAEMIRWLPGYGDTDRAGPDDDPDGPSHDECLSDAVAPSV